jgi:O-antigen ligase
MPKMAKRELFALVYFLIGMMFVVSIYVLANFVANYEEVMDLLGRGGHLPTPSNHIRFSLTLAITIIGGLTLWSDKFYFRHSGERYLIASITLFLFVFIHILSVRSGIFALYLALLVLAIQYIISRRKFLLGGLSILAILAIPFIAYFAIPSFKLKIDYARWDYLQYVQDIGGNYPDSERIISIKAGMEIAKKYPFLGAGAGDLKQEVKKLYDSEYVGKYNFRMPHNQFVTVLAGTGIAGLALFVFGFFFPLFYRKNFENPVFLAFHTLIFMSFLMESTIENNFGISIYLLFLLIGLVYLNQSPDISASPEDETTPAPDLTLSK